MNSSQTNSNVFLEEIEPIPDFLKNFTLGNVMFGPERKDIKEFIETKGHLNFHNTPLAIAIYKDNDRNLIVTNARFSSNTIGSANEFQKTLIDTFSYNQALEVLKKISITSTVPKRKPSTKEENLVVLGTFSDTVENANEFKKNIAIFNTIYREVFFESNVEESLSDTPEARLKRLETSDKKPKGELVTIYKYDRNRDVVAEVLLRAKGKCEKCKNDAPFFKKKRDKKGNKVAYLEVHHKIQLAHGGDDTVENAEALCPNCHREAHFG